MTLTDRADAEHIKMTQTPIAKLLFSLSLPTVLSMLISSIYNTADTYFVSSISDSAVGAVGIVFSLQSIIQAVGFGFAMGGGSLVSLKLGEKDVDSANKYANTAFFSAMFFGFILLLVCSVDLDGMLLLFGSTETILPYAHGYALVILMGAPLMCSTFVLNNLLRAQGKALFSMVAMMSGGFINIILDPIFIFGLKMGVTGAAVATVISQCISFAILLSFYLRRKSVLYISPRYISRKVSDYFLIIKTGAPTVFRQGLGSLSTTLLNVQVKVYGDAAVAAVSLANKVYMLVRSIILGVGQGFQPIAGYNYGAGKKQRVKKAFWVATLLGSAVACTAAVVMTFFAPHVIGFFRDGDATVIEIGSRMLKIMAISLPALGYSSYVNMMYQSLGFVKGATFLASCRQGIFFLPLIFVLPMLLGLDGVLITQPLSDLLTFAVSVPFHIRFFKKVLKKDAT